MARENMTGTKSEEDQWATQNQCFRIYDIVFRLPPHAQSVNFEVQRENHIDYLTRSLKHLGPNFYVLDANRPWLCYWIIHSIAVLGDCIDDELENRFIDFLSRCQDQDGGYGGGPGQMPHLATTYAAINALITVGGQKSLSSINRDKLYEFLLRMKDASGGFRMHDGGELDVRACYTAISVASILNILDDRLIQNVGDYIVSCQTYEGGIAGEPGTEAHGGYTFCGLAAMVLINETDRLDLPALINWVVFRQGVEGGFQGRTNKLVDGCYSFWQMRAQLIAQNTSFKAAALDSASMSSTYLHAGGHAILFGCRKIWGYLNCKSYNVCVFICTGLKGGVAAIFQRLHLTVNKQLGLPNTFEYDCTRESGNDSSDTDGEELSEGSSSPVDISKTVKEGKLSSSAATGLNHGYDFIRKPIGMRPLFNSMFLQQYILLCAQEEAGFRDKPGKRRDHYHTCYVLSGLSICQHCNTRDTECPPLSRDVMGPYSNLIEPVHPLHNVVLDKYYEAYNFFATA